MSIPVGYLHHTREAASRAGREARPDQQSTPRPQSLQQAVVTEVQEFGYQVGVYGDNGEVTGTLDGVLPYPEQDLTVGAPVWLFVPAGVAERPVIMVSGGGGGCQAAVTDWGTLFG